MERVDEAEEEQVQPDDHQSQKTAQVSKAMSQKGKSNKSLREDKEESKEENPA